MGKIYSLIFLVFFSIPVLAIEDVPYPPDFYRDSVDLTPIKRSIAHILGFAGGQDPWQRMGTGVVYAESATSFYVLTAGHVLVRQPFVQFNYAGRRSEELPVTVVKRTYVAGTIHDFAVLKLEKTALSGYPRPTVIPVADPSEELKVGGYIMAARAGLITFGTLEESDGYTMLLNMIVYPGHSGSPVFDRKGTKVFGIILTQNDPKHFAGAVGHKLLHPAVYAR